MVVRSKHISFFGNIIGADGIEPDPDKVTATCNTTAPTDVKELQTFLGLANNLGKCTPRLATVSAPLRYVCQTDVLCDWGPEHDAAFSNLKKTISSNEVLRYHDSTTPLVIQVQAGPQEGVWNWCGQLGGKAGRK